MIIVFNPSRMTTNMSSKRDSPEAVVTHHHHPTVHHYINPPRVRHEAACPQWDHPTEMVGGFGTGGGHHRVRGKVTAKEQKDFNKVQRATNSKPQQPQSSENTSPLTEAKSKTGHRQANTKHVEQWKETLKTQWEAGDFDNKSDEEIKQRINELAKVFSRSHGTEWWKYFSLEDSLKYVKTLA